MLCSSCRLDRCRHESQPHPPTRHHEGLPQTRASPGQGATCPHSRREHRCRCRSSSTPPSKLVRRIALTEVTAMNRRAIIGTLRIVDERCWAQPPGFQHRGYHSWRPEAAVQPAGGRSFAIEGCTRASRQSSKTIKHEVAGRASDRQCSDDAASRRGRKRNVTSWSDSDPIKKMTPS